ncbi:MAG: glutathione S-transferase family protein [Hydrogenophilaceae bacterium]|jgi:glutathione S-transferase|nr:glutathione S-transferase family protein [Hydrogenophilaceae bacterium]
MKLYNSRGPNPHVVRMFLAEKGVSIPLVEVDVMKAENREAAHLARNPHGQLPALELDDGSFLSEVIPICEYLEELHPEPALIGRTPKQRAETRMWTRRVDLNICEPMANGFRFGVGLELFKPRIVTVPEAADGLLRIARDRQGWLDSQIAGRTWICGDRFSLADIHLYCFVAFGALVGQPLDPALANLIAWRDRVAARPSAQA